MADVVAVSAPMAMKKARKSGGAAKAKKPSDHPKYSAMIKDALNALKERGGSSRQAILKFIAKQYKLGGDERTINAHLKMALRAGVKNGTLKQSKGTGAAGSFRLGEKKVAEKKKPAVKKSGVVKPRKPATAKKPKVAKKTKAASTPKKAAKPKAAKPKSPKPKAAAKPKKPKVTKAKSPKRATKPKAAKAKKIVKK